MNRLEGDTFVTGSLSCQTLSIPAGTLVNADVNAAAGIVATKLQHQHVVTYSQSGDATAVTIPIHCVYGTTATIVAVWAGNVTKAVTDKACTVDVKKDGTTILSAPISLSAASADYTPQAGTLSVTTAATTDVLTVVIAVSGSTGSYPQGVYCTVVIREDAA